VAIHITMLEAERFKKLNAVVLRPTPEGLTVIGGRNGQGKTSVLDAIVYALGGERYKPSEAHARGEGEPPEITIRLSNGLVVSRSGKSGSLRVTDPDGLKGNQGVLDGLMDKLALDLPKFMNSSNKEKAQVLLQIIGVGDKLVVLDKQEAAVFEERRVAGLELTKARAVVDSMSIMPAPSQPVSLTELSDQLSEAHSVNGGKAAAYSRIQSAQGSLDMAQKRVITLEQELMDAKDRVTQLDHLVRTHQADHDGRILVDIEAIKKSIDTAQATNDAVRNNQEYEAAKQTSVRCFDNHNALDEAVADVRAQRASLLDHCDMPIPCLTVQDGELVYNDSKWDCMSSSEQLMVGTSIVKQLNPKSSFVLVDKLEQMDVDTMNAFALWAADQRLQVIATRVSTGDECSIIIEDGQVAK